MVNGMGVMTGEEGERQNQLARMGTPGTDSDEEDVDGMGATERAEASPVLDPATLPQLRVAPGAAPMGGPSPGQRPRVPVRTQFDPIREPFAALDAETAAMMTPTPRATGKGAFPTGHRFQTEAVAPPGSSGKDGAGMGGPSQAVPVLLSRTYDEVGVAEGSNEELNTSFSRVIIVHPNFERSESEKRVCRQLQKAMELRAKYVHTLPVPYDDVPARPDAPYDPFRAPMPQPMEGEITLVCEDSVYFAVDAEGNRVGDSRVPDRHEFYEDLTWLTGMAKEGPVRTFAFRRLKLLDARFELHRLLNDTYELNESKATPHRDVYNVVRVDTHVHLASAATHKHLLRFIKHKLKSEPMTMVGVKEDGTPQTLAGVFDDLGYTAYDLSVDHLDVHAGQSHDLFHRFDRFGAKYNPLGVSALRTLFLKTNNSIGGRYLAELTRQICDDLKQSKYTYAEYRVSIYGKSPDEWSSLASWFDAHKVASRHARWLIQVPRLYSVYHRSGLISNFAEMLDNIFAPLFAVTLNPESDPYLHNLLQQIVGFDSVDDESAPEVALPGSEFPKPEDWTVEADPPFGMYLYYLYANLASLNQLRAYRGLNTFKFRPHVGEAGSVDHLDSAFLLANGINHGINLRKHPAMQFLYYLEQIPIAMSPLSNAALFLAYARNPFPKFFARGLSVSLSTDDPLQFHRSKEPVAEEYAIAAHSYKLTAVDLSELARTSVLQSGFEEPIKRYWLGPDYALPGAAGNDISLSNVPSTRLTYRYEALTMERHLVLSAAE